MIGKIGLTIFSQFLTTINLFTIYKANKCKVKGVSFRTVINYDDPQRYTHRKMYGLCIVKTFSIPETDIFNNQVFNKVDNTWFILKVL